MSTTTDLEVSRAGALALDPAQTEWTDPQRSALEQLGIANAPAGDQLVFLHQAQRTGLDPFAKQIYMIARRDSRAPGGFKYTIQAGIDGLRVIAERTGRYEGRTPISWCGEDGIWRDVWLDPNRPPVAARCGVYKRGFREPLVSVAIFREYAATNKDGTYSSMWSTKGAHMIGKVAESLALRAAFPQDLSSIFTPEETEKDADVPQDEPGAGKPGERIETVSGPPAEYAQPVSEPMIGPKQTDEMFGRFKDLDLGKDAALALCSEVAGREIAVTRLLTAAEADAVIDRLADLARERSGEQQIEPQGEPPETDENGVVDAHIVEDEPASADEADALWPEVAQPGSAR
ncbi:phage recombination protein Bet [Streptomonospora arabica]|uniref:Phage recombination protein Bet n=1 Tax=Streptomonospora arabica TaxID=412417 RepID=A0ABV9SSH3_9ACTN